MNYFQGEDIAFSISFFDEFQSVSGFSEFSEIRAYAYTDGCLYQMFSTVDNKEGYELMTLKNGVIFGIITSEFTSNFHIGDITIELLGFNGNPQIKHDIGKKFIGFLHKSLITE